MCRGREAEARDLCYAFLQVSDVIRFLNAKDGALPHLRGLKMNFIYFTRRNSSDSRWNLVLSSYLWEQTIHSSSLHDAIQSLLQQKSEVNKPQNHNFTEKNQIQKSNVACWVFARRRINLHRKVLWDLLKCCGAVHTEPM